MKRHFYFTNQTADLVRARKIELKIEKQTGLDLENPFYDGEQKELPSLLKGTKITLSADEIVGMDLRKIRDSDGIVALMSNVRNIGSCMEIAIGAYSWGKPVYVIAWRKFYDHPWIKYFATRRFRTYQEFIKWWNETGRKGKH